MAGAVLEIYSAKALGPYAELAVGGKAAMIMGLIGGAFIGALIGLIVVTKPDWSKQQKLIDPETGGGSDQLPEVVLPPP